ncbi:hypothetical protein IEO21_02157 [Rhodonia placenta]|uniref:SWR1-complex protein 5 n=1 Tax=Rhodonia placenta TaxID=104341 RepID=A0A8H7P892_9APHY|nr:hypothetical protein IEO21_02157 [Postia placenta]
MDPTSDSEDDLDYVPLEDTGDVVLQPMRKPATKPPDSSRIVKIEKRYRFAGEDVIEVKEVPEDSEEAKKWPKWQPALPEAIQSSSYTPVESAGPSELPAPSSAQATTSAQELKPAAKRPGPRKPKTKLAPLPGTQKAKKLTTLDKSSMDWRSHVQTGASDLKDELEANRRGGGYLERVEFLQRVEDRKVDALDAMVERATRNGEVSRRSTTYTIPDSFVDDIENAEGWNLIVTMLCEHFKLPDITRRSGLKKVHAHFNEIYKKLNDVYTKNLGNDKIMGGIVGIWAKMFADSILRDRLFKEGLVSKMVPLLDMPSTRHIGLQALSTVTHHGGIASRQEIAKLTPKLLQLINEFSDDAVVMELATVTIAHAIGAVVGQEQEPDHRLLASIDIRSVLKLTVDNLRKPSASHLMINHAVGLLTSVTLHCYKECKAMPPLIQFLTACLRSSDLTTRCNALGGLTRLNGLEAEPNKQFFDPRKIMDAVSRRFPDNLTDIIMDYGMDRCDTTLTLRSSADFQRAMMKCVQDHDLYALGKTIAQLVVRTEFSITGGAYQTMNEQTGQWEIVNTGLPFTMWGDALPHCARALRQKGTKEDLDDAEICELKHHVLQQNIPAAIRAGQEVLQRNPQLAYAHYVIALGADNTQGLKSAKKGLKCKQITPFVRHYLLWRAVEHAGNLGLVVLQQATEGEKDYGEGIAFLVSACEDAKTFISEAPPDNRHMETVLNWYIICSIAIRGPELSNDMRELGVSILELQGMAKDLTQTLDRTRWRR